MKKQLANVKCARVFASLALFMLLSAAVAAQTLVNKEWTVTTGEPSALFDFSVSTLDSYKNLIVVGNTNHPTQQTNFLMTKYNPKGEQLWQLQYDKNGGIDYATSVVSFGGSIYVTGASFDATHGNLDYLTLKISEQGQILWEARYDNGGIDIPSAIQVDVQGNVFVTGGSWSNNSNYDCLTLKYTQNGVQNWATRYDNLSWYDFAMALTPDNTGGCIVAGVSGSSAQNGDFVALRYNSSGVTQNVERITSPDNGFDKPVDVKKDVQGNFYILGSIASNQTDLKLIKLNNQFAVEWTKTFDGGFADEPAKMQIDNNGNIYVICSSMNDKGGQTLMTLKYDNAGNEVWSRQHFAEKITQSAQAKSVDIDNQGNVYVTGKMQQANGTFDYLTLKYDENGEVKWEKIFDNNGLDEAKDLKVDNNGNIYVTGKSTDAAGISHYMMLKYNNIEKPIVPIFDAAGKPWYIKNEIIVKFKKTALKKEKFESDYTEIIFGKPADFLQSEAIREIEQAIDVSISDLHVRKVHFGFTPKDTFSISRQGEYVKIPEFWRVLTLKFDNANDVTYYYNTLKTLNCVEYSEPNYLASPIGDPLYGTQGSLHATPFYRKAHINMDSAWTYETGKPFVRVGIFDTGIKRLHNDYKYGTLGLSKVVKGFNTFNNTNTHTSSVSPDIDGHGTGVSGIIGAIRNNDIAIAGIAGGTGSSVKDSTGVELYDIKIFNGSNFSGTEAVARAMVKSSVQLPNTVNDTLNYRLHIMNHSWAGGRNESLIEGFYTAYRNGVVVVCGRGNSGTNVAEYPACFANNWILSVAASDTLGNKAPFSSYGKGVDVCAPGTKEIVCTLSLFSDNCVILNGTSFAAPHVAGEAALLLSYLNNADTAYQNLVHDDVEYLIKNSTDDINDIRTGSTAGYDDYTGYGKVNVYKALKMVDKSRRRLVHFGTKKFPSTISAKSLIRSNISVSPTFQYTCPSLSGNIMWSSPSFSYLVDAYKFTATVNHSAHIANGEKIVAKWVRNDLSNLWGLYDSTTTPASLFPSEMIKLDTIINGIAYLSGYVYRVKDDAGFFMGWAPFNPDDSMPRLEYSLLIQKNTTATNDVTESELNLKIYPNPTENIATLQFNILEPLDSEITLLDIQGRKVTTIHKGRFAQGAQSIEIPLTHLASGVYLLHMRLGNLLFHKKIVKL